MDQATVLYYSVNPQNQGGMGKVGLETAKRLSDDFDLHYYAPACASGRPLETCGFALHGSSGDGMAGLYNLIKDINPDLILTNKNWQSLTGLDVPLNDWYQASGETVPIVIYGPPLESITVPPRFSQKLLDDHLQPVRVIPYTGDQYGMLNDSPVEKYLSDKFVPHGINSDVFHPKDDDAGELREKLNIGDRSVVGIVSDNWRRKNLDLLFQGFADFSESVDGNPLLLAHSPPIATRGHDPFYSGWDLADLADETGLTSAQSKEEINESTDVIWTVKRPLDFVSDEEVATLLSMIDIMCLPTSGESFSLTTVEAHACGTPVLQSRLDTLEWVSRDAAEYVEPVQTHQINTGETMITPGVDSISYKLEYLYNNESRREEMVSKGFTMADRFSWDKTSNLLKIEIEDLLSEYI